MTSQALPVIHLYIIEIRPIQAINNDPGIETFGRAQVDA